MNCTDLAELQDWVTDARARTLWLLEDLNEQQLLGPQLAIVNPPLWEMGHIAWFQEKWILRHAAGRRPLREDGDRLYDSAEVAHGTRWNLPLPSREETWQYAINVRDRVLDALHEESDRLAYFVKLSVFHEDMHTEAFTCTRQTLGYPPPPRLKAQSDNPESDVPNASQGFDRGDVCFSGGKFSLGASKNEDFVFDNEKWAHPVEVPPFAIARDAVTQSEFARFVDDAGYQRRHLWSDAGWRWREAAGALHPVYWRRDAQGRWQRRVFDTWRPLEPARPAMHVNFHEAEAYCRWAGRRLPTEAEWELAASAASTGQRQIDADSKRRFPWGHDRPTPKTANLDWRAGGTVDVAALPAGDSAAGCRQMIGNLWEWTASDFQPYPGFVPDPYREYSQPWFGTHKVLRGGCWATRGRLIRNTWRNFYTPDRRDVWAGFRTCALRSP